MLHGLSPLCCDVGRNTETWKHYSEADVLARVRVRLIRPEEKARRDELICRGHYLGNAHLVGRQLRYVAELDGEWVPLLGWNVAVYHLTPDFAFRPQRPL